MRESTRKVDIALFLPSLEGGGAEKVFVTLSDFFSRKGFVVDLIVARKKGPLLSFVPSSVRLIDLKASRPSRGIPALMRYLRNEQPRALLSALTHANIAAVFSHLLAGGVHRCIVTEHSVLTYSFNRQRKMTDRWLLKIVGRHAYRWADAVVAVSNGVAQSLHRELKVPEENVRVIHNPVDIDLIRRNAREEVLFPWEDDLPVLISVGRLTAVKNFSLLLHAFKRVLEKKNCHLVILGDGELRQDLQSLSFRLGVSNNVWFPGFVHNPYAYMARSSLFVLSSEYEAFSLVLIEALALGLPIIATDCPYGPREILDNGRFGVLVPPGNEEELAEAIIRVIDGNISIPNFEESLNRFYPEKVINQYLDLIGF